MTSLHVCRSSEACEAHRVLTGGGNSVEKEEKRGKEEKKLMKILQNSMAWKKNDETSVRTRGDLELVGNVFISPAFVVSMNNFEAVF